MIPISPRDPDDRRLGRVVALAVAFLGLVAGIFPIFESDLFWHLAAGRWILEHVEVPRVDPFRFTSDGAPWVDHEWLFQVLARGVEALAGLDGLIVARAVALAGFGLLLFAVCRRAGIGAGLAGLLAVGALLGVRPRFLVRPEIATLYCVVLLLHLLERRSGKLGEEWGSIGRLRSWWAWPAPVLLTFVWVQFHGEAMLAPGLAFLFLLGVKLGGNDRSRVSAAWLFGLPTLLAAVLLLNPYGWRLLEVPLGIGRAMRDLPAMNPEWASAFAAPQPYMFAGLAIVATLAFAGRRATGRIPAPEWGLPALAMAGLALSAVRHQALFYAVAAPYAARCLALLPEVRETSPRAARRLAAAAVGVALAAALWCAFPPASGPLRPRHGGLRWGFGVDASRFPVRAAERLAVLPEVGPLYNEFVHGGYLLWRTFPPRQVFLDGRMELDPALLHEIGAARRSAEGWEALLRREGAAGALVLYDERPVPVLEPDGSSPAGMKQVDARTIHSLLFPPERWSLVDWDDRTMLFLAAGSASASAWPGEPYRFVQPEDLRWMLARASTDREFRAGALAEVERKLREQPDCLRALRLAEALQAPR